MSTELLSYNTADIRKHITHLRDVLSRLSSVNYDSDTEERLESCHDEIQRLEKLIENVLEAKRLRLYEYETQRSLILSEMSNPSAYITYETSDPDDYISSDLMSDYIYLTLYDEDTKLR